MDGRSACTDLSVLGSVSIQNLHPLLAISYKMMQPSKGAATSTFSVANGTQSFLVVSGRGLVVLSRQVFSPCALEISQKECAFEVSFDLPLDWDRVAQCEDVSALQCALGGTQTLS